MTSQPAPGSVAKLTAEQGAALAADDRSLALAAGAGCGKTLVLTERFLAAADRRSTASGSGLMELAAITFTDAAAREMRSRIRRSCYDRLRDAPTPSDADAWLQLMRDIDSAQISTFHSFCAALLRRCAVEADIDPRFELLDQAAANLLQIEIVDDLLRELLDQRDERVLKLAAATHIERLRDDLTDMLGEMLAMPTERVEKWLAMTPTQLAEHWRNQFYDEVAPAARDALIAHEAFCRLLEVANPLRGDDRRLVDHLAKLDALLRTIERADKIDSHSFVQLRDVAKVHPFITAKKWCDAEDHPAYRDACQEVRKLLDKSPLLQPFDSTFACKNAAMSLDYLSLAVEARGLVSKRKAERRQLEFADLVLGVHRLMTDSAHSATAKRISSEIKLLMVDEFQDTDPLQVELVQALVPNWQERGLFVVGDAKQSIYRFRGAAPEVSRQLRESLPTRSRLSLTHNFRSQPAIIDFVNGLFYDALDEPYEPLHASKPQLGPLPCVEFLLVPRSNEQDELAGEAPSEAVEQGVDAKTNQVRKQTSAGDGRRLEAKWIARRLRQLLHDGPPLVADANAAGGVRRLRQGDVAILFRALSDVAIYEEALRDHGIDYHLAGGHAFYSQQEVYDVLNLLRSLASVVDETSLAGALRSPFFALTDEGLFWLVETHGSLNQAIVAAQPPAELTPHEADKFVRAATTLQTLRLEKDRLLVAELIGAALARTGYDAVLQGEFLGDRKLANLEKLVEQARRLDRTSPGDLPGFIAQLSEFVARPPKEALAAVQAEGDAVRLMTIHHAKGLEFPLVVLPDLDRTENLSHRRPIVDERLGPVVPGRETEGLAGWDVYRFREERLERDERKRLFYVACTRAADYLLLSASVTDLAKSRSEAMKMLQDRFELTSGEYIGPEPPGLLRARPKIRVTNAEPPLVGSPLAERERAIDVLKVVEKTRRLAAKLAAEGKGGLPLASLPLVQNKRFHRSFSFSRLSGELSQVADEGEPLAEARSDVGSDLRSKAANHPDPRTLGLLVHALLEQFDFSAPSKEEHFAATCARASRALLADEPTLNVARDLVDRFIRSPRADQLASSESLVRETEFLLAWPLPGEEGPPRYLQGVIDCLYCDAAGTWRLIDYKTNRVTRANLARAAAPYEIQMFVYSEACRRVLGVDPVETTLCFLAADAEYSFEWTSARRRSSAEKLTRALQAAIASSMLP